MGILCIALEGKEVSKMAQYIVKMLQERHEKFYFIKEAENEEIVLLPSKLIIPGLRPI